MPDLKQCCVLVKPTSYGKDDPRLCGRTDHWPILALARAIIAADAAPRGGQWPRLSGVSLEGQTVGLLRLGAIGRQVARRRHGFDCLIVAHDPAADAKFARAHSVRLMPADDVIAQVLHIELTDALFARLDEAAATVRA